MFNRVLILSATSGAGHVRAAQAIEQAFKESGAAKEVRNVDALEYTSPMLRQLYSKTYIDMVNKAPTLLGWLYDVTDKPWKAERRRLAFDRLNARPLMGLLKKYQPDLVVCTHFMPAEIISWLLCTEKIDTKHCIVVTDFDVHAMWLCRHYDHYFAALQESKEHLHKMGVPLDRISVTGIPIDPIFTVHKDRTEMRKKHGLDLDKPIILMSSGGFGVGKTTEILQSLGELSHPVQVLAMCGRNEQLQDELNQMSKLLKEQGRLLDIKPVGFTKEMDEYMSAADILLGKPGGLTTSEALAKGLAFVIVNPIPGQEERNSDHLLEEGAGIRCNNLPALAYKLDKLLDEPEKLESLRANSRRLGKPKAAAEIVADLLKMQESGFTAAAKHSSAGHSCLSPQAKLWVNATTFLKKQNLHATRVL